VIRRVSRENSADAVLHEELKRRRDLPPFVAAEISRIVFRHYRWLGWLREERNLENKFRRAQALEQLFLAKPETIPAGELRLRAVPAWVAEGWALTSGRAPAAEPKLWVRLRQWCAGPQLRWD
jgi:hypothetical protein